MLTVFPYSAKDQDQAVRLAEWIRELGPNKSHHALIVRDRRCDLEHDKAILAALEQTFAAVETLTVKDDAYDSWPESANAMFRNAAKHVEFTKKEPFLWLEPDVAPLKEGWLDAIAAEYVEAVAAGKHFMGDRVEVENVPLHMSGVACYPGIMSNHAGLAYLAQDIAWDCAAAAQIVPQAHFTNLILHAWKHPSFTSWEMVEREILAFKPEAVLFHADKTSGLIDRLRERRFVNAVAPIMSQMVAEERVNDEYDGTPEQTAEAMRSLAVPQIICDIFIKTYPPDFPFLQYCLRSIERFTCGFRRVIILSSESGIPNPDRSSFEEIIEPEVAGEDGYLRQQIAKLYADTLTDASHILFLDSDTIFTRPVTPKTFFTNYNAAEIPHWMMTPWEKTNTPWRPIVEKFMGQPVEYEFMRRHPTVVPSWLLTAVREFCLQQHGMPLDQYVMSQPHRAFSEFNVLGAFAYAFHRDKFFWVNTEEVSPEDWPELTVLQKFSWGGLTDEVKAEFETILGKEGDAKCQNQKKESNVTIPSAPFTPQSKKEQLVSSAAPTFKPDSAATATRANGAPLLATLPQQVPWESKEQSLEEIRSLAERLKNFCGKASHVRAVRLELHKLGVIELPYRFKRRRGKWRSKKK